MKSNMNVLIRVANHPLKNAPFLKSIELMLAEQIVKKMFHRHKKGPKKITTPARR